MVHLRPLTSEIRFRMYYKFDVGRWVLHQLPMILRTSLIYEFIRCLLHPIKTLYSSFYDYSTSVERQLGHNSNTLMLQKWLNDVLGVKDEILIQNYLNERISLHFSNEPYDEVYMGYINETDGLYLSSELSNEFGGFLVMVPSYLATEENLMIIKKWVEYYKTAGTVYRIMKYE